MDRAHCGSSGDFFLTMHKMSKVKMADIFEDITEMEFITLDNIEKDSCDKVPKRVKMSDIAKCTGAHFSAVSRTISGLEQRGLVVRMSDSGDRRTTYVELTDPGRERLRECRAELDDFLNSVFERVGEDDINELKRIMEKIYDVTDDELEKRKNPKE